MEYVKGFNFAPFARKGTFRKEEARESIDRLIAQTGANFIIIVPNGLQETAQSEEICYTSVATMDDEELVDLIGYAKEKGLRVALKPTANCKNGTWRAYINFFDEEVHCEPKWSKWFASYTDFQLHYATIAQKTGCELFIAGCEMIMAERRETEWRTLIGKIREVFHGLVSYNTDKYQEHNVTWWDCLDVISSSGYYPLSDWEQELDRIEQVVKKYNKPFIFAEIGCMSTEGASLIPNDWTVEGKVDLEEQKAWYQAFFKAVGKRPWVYGMALWEWKLCPVRNPHANGDYCVEGKPVQDLIKDFYQS